MTREEIISNNLEKLREPSKESFVNIFNILKKYEINPSEEMMKELGKEHWNSITLGFNQGLQAMADIIEERFKNV